MQKIFGYAYYIGNRHNWQLIYCSGKENKNKDVFEVA